MGASFGSDALQERKIRDWLLRELADRLAVLAAADELDASGAKGPVAPRFFNRTSKAPRGACPVRPHSEGCTRVVSGLYSGRASACGSVQIPAPHIKPATKQMRIKIVNLTTLKIFKLFFKTISNYFQN
jgi:hypothetical protein